MSIPMAAARDDPALAEEAADLLEKVLQGFLSEPEGAGEGQAADRDFLSALKEAIASLRSRAL